MGGGLHQQARDSRLATRDLKKKRLLHMQQSFFLYSALNHLS